MYRIVAHYPNGSSDVIYDPVGTGPLPVLAPRSTEEVNEAGSLEFSLLYGHPAFDKIEPKATYVTAELNGSVFFSGRVISAEPSVLTGQVQCTCSGALSFLQDSELPQDPKKTDGSGDAQTMTAEAFFRRCVSNHNSDIGNDPRRTFIVGTINHPEKDTSREYSIGSYTDTLSAIKQNVTELYGGFLKVRPRTAGGFYIDWLERYGATDAGTLELGENIINLTNRITSEEMVTAIRPVGKDGLTLSGSKTINLLPQSGMNKYGKIIKSINFNDCETEAELRSAANRFVSQINVGYLISSDIKLVDMKFVDSHDRGVRIGDVFTNIAGLEGETMVVATRSRDFENPQNDSVSLRNLKEFDGDSSGGSYRSGKTKAGASSISKRSSRNSASGGTTYKYIHEIDDELQLAAKHISINAEQLEMHADQFTLTNNTLAILNHKAETMADELGVIQGTGVIQNSDHITSIAGKFQYDKEHNKVELVEGTELTVHDQNGATITVGTRISQLGQKMATFEGSALWSQRNAITGVVGEFDVQTGSDGKKTLVVKSGGGMKVERNGVQYGVYDNGTLTGGMIVDKLNDDSVTTTIKGDRIRIEGTTKLNDVLIVTGKAVGVQKPLITSNNIDINSTGTLNLYNLKFQGSKAYTLTAPIISTMIKTATKSGNTLTLTRFDGTTETFSSATTLTGTWGGSGNKPTYTVAASPQGTTSKVSMSLELRGTPQYSQVPAQLGTYDKNNNFIKHGEVTAYLKEVVNGTKSYVDIRPTSTGGTSTAVARISTKATYNAGVKAAVSKDDISITTDKTGYTSQGSDCTSIFANFTFTNQMWYRFTVKVKGAEKKYAIYVKTS